MELDLLLISEWTTGRSDDALHVALIVKTADGEELAIALPAETAIALGEELAAQGLRQLAGRGALN
jgi:hypothetical protein